jgi:hypothetical protein
MILNNPIILTQPPYADQTGKTITPGPIVLNELDVTYHINPKAKNIYATILRVPSPISLATPADFHEVTDLSIAALEGSLREKIGENVQAYLQSLFPRTLESDPNGPGTILSGMISALGIHSTPNCSCRRHALQMNASGPDWCEQNMDTILGWLKEESSKRKLPFVETVARLMVQRAINKSRRLLAKVQKQS